MSSYAENLTAAKQEYPFDNWKSSIDDGLEMWTLEECDEMIDTFDSLIAHLIALGENGAEKEKVALFEEAVDKTNEWTGSIDTLAREDLIDLIDTIANAAGLGYIDNDGEGLSAGRDW
ncbi:hypothetical protein GCM10027422_40530 [Hymenobacter arcticus]